MYYVIESIVLTISKTQINKLWHCFMTIFEQKIIGLGVEGRLKIMKTILTLGIILCGAIKQDTNVPIHVS